MSGHVLVGDKIIAYGYSNFQDWIISVLESFPPPWALLPLDGKYYGTLVEDARGICVLSVWDTRQGFPSDRELADREGTLKEWEDENCDEHWESEYALSLARRLIAARNGQESEEDFQDLVPLILTNTRFEEAIWKELQAGGGPLRRALTSEEAKENTKKPWWIETGGSVAPRVPPLLPEGD